MISVEEQLPKPEQRYDNPNPIWCIIYGWMDYIVAKFVLPIDEHDGNLSYWVSWNDDVYLGAESWKLLSKDCDPSVGVCVVCGEESPQLQIDWQPICTSKDKEHEEFRKECV